MESPLMFNVLVFSGATHKAFYQSPTVDNSKSALLRLSSKVQTIKALNSSLREPETMLTDQVIFAVLLMCIIGNGEKVTAAEKRESRPLATAQDAQFYASLEYEWRHMDALIELVKRKGGLHTIALPGLAFAIASWVSIMMYQTDARSITDKLSFQV